MRYGWIIVGTGVLSIAIHTVVGYSNALFLVPIADTNGWSRMVVSASLSAYSLGTGLWVPVVGFLVDGWGPRRLIPLAGIVLMGGLLALSTVQSPMSLSLAMLFPVALGSVGVGGLVNYAAIQPWFLEQRGTAFAIAAGGSSIGVLMMPALQFLILNVGWRSAYRVMAAIAVGLALLHLRVQRQPSSTPLSDADGDAATLPNLGITAVLRSRVFWLVFLGIGASSFAGSLVMIHHVAYVTDQGLSPASVNAALGTIGVAGLVGRIGFGRLSDRIGTTRVFFLIAICLSIAIGFLTLAGQTGSALYLYLFGLTFGCSFGVAPVLFSRLVADFFGSRNFGRVMGMAYMGGSIGVAGGPAFAGAAFDATGGYLSSFAVATVALVFFLFCAWSLRHTDGRWKIDSLQV